MITTGIVIIIISVLFYITYLKSELEEMESWKNEIEHEFNQFLKNKEIEHIKVYDFMKSLSKNNVKLTSFIKILDAKRKIKPLDKELKAELNDIIK